MIAEIVITALTCLALDALTLFCVAKFTGRDGREFNAKRENR